MNSLKFFVVALAFVSGAVQARSLHPDTFRNEVAPALSQVEVTKVASTGEVVKQDRRHPFSEFTIAIPVTVNPGSACTAFVGQQTTVERSGLKAIQMMGASDPVNDVCIAVMPEPVNTKLSFKFQVLTGGFVPAQSIQTQIIQILPLGLYQVTLDMGNNSVTVAPVGRRPRN